MYAWSESDYCQLKHEIACKNIEDPKVESFMNCEKWIDYQAVFGKRFGFARAVSLEEALLACDIGIDGRLHDGLNDALNTANLIKTLEMNADFQLCKYEIPDKNNSGQLNFCLGDLLAGLDLTGVA